MKYVLIIGNSHSIDAFWMLGEAWKDLTGERLTLGVLYYSGCSITKHIEFVKNGDKLCRYYKNTDGRWDVMEGWGLDGVLADQPWDTVFLQAAKSDLDDTLNRAGRRELEALVDERLKTPHRFMWHTSWPSPNDERFFSPDYRRQAPAGYKERLVNLYGFDPINQFAVLTDKAKAHILDDAVYEKAICTGAGIMNAHFVQGVEQMEIWRDYTHLRDFGRLVAAYSMATQLLGKSVERVSITCVPVEMRHGMFQELGDMEVTAEMQQVIQKAANHALADPWTVPVRA